MKTFNELLNQEFECYMDEYISESGMDYEYDFDRDSYLESFNDDYKLDVILSNVLALNSIQSV